MKEIIWLDPEIEGDENTQYFNELNNLEKCHITRIKSVEQAINKMNDILFKETIIIVSGKLFTAFIDEFKKDLNNICFMPNIIIFTANSEEFRHSVNIEHQHYLNHKFYNSGGIETNFKKVIEFVEDPNHSKNKNIFIDRDDGQFSFDYIDTKEKLLLQMLYKYLIDYNENDNLAFIKMLYAKYYTKSNEIRHFLDSINSINEIPVEILCKFYVRIYTDEQSKFYKDLNGDLRKNIRDIYLPFIKALYEGVKLKALPLYQKDEKDELFRGTFLLSTEIEEMEKYKNKEKKNNLPGGIIFSKSFLSFTKKRKIAENFFNNQTPIKSQQKSFKVLFILKMKKYKDPEQNYILSTHADIQNLSLIKEEEEVLFFPFSSFEITDINKNNNEVYEIELKYLGKYFEKVEKDIDLLKSVTKLPKTNFANEIVEYGLIKKEQLNKNVHEFVQIVQINKQKIRTRRNPIYHRYNPIYPVYKTINPIHYPIYRKPYIIRRFLKIETKYSEDSSLREFPDPTPISQRQHPAPPVPTLPRPQAVLNKNKKPNFIMGQIIIGKNDVNKNVRVINSFEKAKSKYNFIKIDNESLFKNEKEIIDNCEIAINGIKIPQFSYYLIFPKPGIYYIEYYFKSNITKTDFMFAECFNLQSLDLLAFDFKDVTNMICMFLQCENLREITLSNLETKNINDMNGVFFGCKSLLYLDLAFFNTQNVRNMSRLFFGCKSLKNINLSSFNTQNVIDMYDMFNGCESLLNLELLNFYTQNVINMSRMFYGCRSLKTLDLSNFMTNQVKYMNSMFYGCNKLSQLNISNFNFEKIINMDDIFTGCFSLNHHNIICKNKNELIKNAMI